MAAIDGEETLRLLLRPGSRETLTAVTRHAVTRRTEGDAVGVTIAVAFGGDI